MDGERVVSIFCGWFGCMAVGKSFLERGVDMMYELDLTKVNKSMVKAVKLCVAIRRHLGKDGVEHAEFMDLEREIREAGAECQRVMELVEADAARPLISG